MSRVAALAAVSLLYSTACAQDSQGDGEAVGAEVATPVRRPLTRTVRLPGTLMAYERVELHAKASGYVDRVLVDIGDAVRAGAPLLVLSIPEMADEVRRSEAMVEAKRAKVRAFEAQVHQRRRGIETAQATVRRHEAEHDLAALNLKRNVELREANAIPEQALDDARGAMAVAEAEVAIAHAEVEGARARLTSVQADRDVAIADVGVAEADLARLRTLMEYATVRAPFDGVVTMRGVDPGAFVRSAQDGATRPLLTIATKDRIRLAVDIPEVDAPFVRKATKVTFRVDALGDASRSATVSRLAGTVHPATRTMRAEIDIENSDGTLVPGMYARVTIDLETKASALLVPAKALKTREGAIVVLVVADGRAEARPVRIGYDDGIWAEVLNGLQGDERVIVSTGGAVVEGTRVRTIQSPGS